MSATQTVWDLAVGHRVRVIHAGRPEWMTVTWISPPLWLNRPYSAGPMIHATGEPGGPSTHFDVRSDVEWEAAPFQPWDDVVIHDERGGQHAARVDEQIDDEWVSVYVGDEPTPSNVPATQLTMKEADQ